MHKSISWRRACVLNFYLHFVSHEIQNEKTNMQFERFNPWSYCNCDFGLPHRRSPARDVVMRSAPLIQLLFRMHAAMFAPLTEHTTHTRKETFGGCVCCLFRLWHPRNELPRDFSAETLFQNVALRTVLSPASVLHWSGAWPPQQAALVSFPGCTHS